MEVEKAAEVGTENEGFTSDELRAAGDIYETVETSVVAQKGYLFVYLIIPTWTRFSWTA